LLKINFFFKCIFCFDNYYSGGNDKIAVVFNNTTEQIVATFKGHTKRLTQVIYHPDEVTKKNRKTFSQIYLIKPLILLLLLSIITIIF
jgi:hypothetical protein